MTEPAISGRSKDRPSWQLVVYPREQIERLSTPKLAMWAFVNVGGPGGEYLLARVATNGTLKDISGLVIETDFLDGRGANARPPDERIARDFQIEPCGTIFHTTPRSAVFVHLFPAPVNDFTLLADAHQAAIRTTDAWLHRHDLRPVEYAPGRWRGGFVVRADADPARPVLLPRAIVDGQRRDAAIYLASGDLLSADRLIARAKRIAPPPPVSFPTVQARRGVLESMLILMGKAV